MSVRPVPAILSTFLVVGAIGCKPGADQRDDQFADALRSIANELDLEAANEADPCVSVPRMAEPVPATRPASNGEYKVIGELGDADRRELEDLVARQTADPILGIRVIRSGVVEVTTGVVRGPLGGGGSIFDFEKRDGRWFQINENAVKVWRS